MNYAGCIDRRDWAGLQESYTEDGVMQHGEASVPRRDVPELDCELKRTDGGWRFTRVRSTTAWRTGEPLELH